MLLALAARWRGVVPPGWGKAATEKKNVPTHQIKCSTCYNISLYHVIISSYHYIHIIQAYQYMIHALSILFHYCTGHHFPTIKQYNRHVPHLPPCVKRSHQNDHWHSRWLSKKRASFCFTVWQLAYCLNFILQMINDKELLHMTIYVKNTFILWIKVYVVQGHFK